MDKIKAVSAIVDENAHGQRLDAALASLYPQLGLRARRRLWEWCRVLLDGREAGPGAYVRAGQKIEVVPTGAGQGTGPAGAESPLWGEVRIVAATESYAAAYKPGGLPSARVSGGRNYSVEEYLRENWAKFGAGEAPLLCNRLDTPTSGLLLLSFGPKNLERFKTLEAAGAVKKYYYALVRGAAPDELYLDRALDTAGREKTLVRPEADRDATRHSAARRLSLLERAGEECSLLEVLIKRGARHQIRAHLASAGFPIVGDSMYGTGAGESAASSAGSAENGIMHLHHCRIAFEGFSAEAPPPWPAFTAWAEAGFQSP